MAAILSRERWVNSILSCQQTCFRACVCAINPQPIPWGQRGHSQAKYKDGPFRYGYYHCKDKRVRWQAYFYNGMSRTSKNHFYSETGHFCLFTLSWIGRSRALSLQWRHNERHGISNHRRLDCSLNRLFRHRSNKTSRFHVIVLCEGNSPVTSEFPAQRTRNTENVPIWWRHHVEL